MSKLRRNRVSTQEKFFYRDSGKPVSKFIDLFGVGFMTLLGIAILWLTIANWSDYPSWYLLVSGLGLLGFGAPQLNKYSRAEKVSEFKYKCFDCKHQWDNAKSRSFLHQELDRLLTVNKMIHRFLCGPFWALRFAVIPIEILSRTSNYKENPKCRIQTFLNCSRVCVAKV